MQDLISRQAAIEALDKRFDSIPMEQTTEILLLRKDLRNLPSAQPELIRCKDCKHYYALNEVRGNCSEYNFVEKIPIDFCSWAERKEHEVD